jgi:FtsP/CotA-like multicopper oxidase with cupredoxin domain
LVKIVAWEVNRRTWLALTGLGSLVGGVLGVSRLSAQQARAGHPPSAHDNHAMGPVGRVPFDDFNPTQFLRTWNFSNLPPEERTKFYRETPRPDGTLLREYEVYAVDRQIEIAPGVFFPAWTYNGQVPGPTIRATEGDRLKVTFRNVGSHPHTIHFHGWHRPEVDGALPSQEVMPGGTFVYEFDADPFGLHLYHCHTVPLKRHIHKGLYGAFIVDPRGGRPPADEMVMVMNAFDTNFDAENEVYAVNTVANAYMQEPIRVTVGRPVRIYLVNLTEFDPVNSLHLHAMFFDVFRTGTSLTPSEKTDTLMLCQGERAIVETTFRYPGDFMFHAHQSEFSELGWMGLFRAVEAGSDT